MPSAFIQFSNEKRKEVQEANPKAGFGEMGKLLGKMWRGLSDAEKSKYVSTKTRAKRALAKPERDSAKGAKPERAQEEEEEEQVKPKKGTRKKRSLSPYIQFCNKHRNQVKKDNPGASFGELGKILGKMWREK